MCGQGCGYSICQSCDAASKTAAKLCNYCLAWFAEEKLPLHQVTCNTHKCPYTGCGKDFANSGDRHRHMWTTCTLTYANASIAKANQELAAQHSAAPSYSSSSYSSSSSSAQACRHCNGTKVEKYGDFDSEVG